jgi:site-specific recombinase XerD
LRHYGAAIRAIWAPSTVKGSVGCIRSYLRFLEDEALASEPLISALKIPSVPKQVQRTISDVEFMALMKACARPVTYGLTEREAMIAAVRNAAIISLLYDSLMRASEMIALKVADVDMKRRLALIKAGKGGDFRYTTFGEETEVALARWLKVRRVPSDAPWLFVSIAGNTPGEQLTVRGLRSIVKALGERAGVPDVSPHAFRRGGAVEKARNGIPLRMLQAEAGWASVQMADIYTRALTLTPETAPEVQQYSPVTSAKRRRGAKSAQPNA